MAQAPDSQNTMRLNIIHTLNRPWLTGYSKRVAYATFIEEFKLNETIEAWFGHVYVHRIYGFSHTSPELVRYANALGRIKIGRN